MTERRPPRLFTLSEANRMLPLVAAIVEDWIELTRSISERQKRLDHLMSGRQLDSDDPYTVEMVQVRRELAQGLRQIDDYAKELRQLGVHPGDSDLGTVDFPGQIDGEDVLFCWQFGDAEIRFWHQAGNTCTQRQPLAAATLADGN